VPDGGHGCVFGPAALAPLARYLRLGACGGGAPAGLEGTDLVRKLGNTQGGLPFSVMVDAQGKLMQRKMGETDFKQLAGWAGKS